MHFLLTASKAVAGFSKIAALLGTTSEPIPNIYIIQINQFVTKLFLRFLNPIKQINGAKQGHNYTLRNSTKQNNYIVIIDYP